MKKQSITFSRNTLIISLLCLVIASGFSNIIAQEIVGVSVCYDYFPYTKLKDNIAEAPNLKIHTNTTIGTRLAFPVAFKDGKVLIKNYLEYKRVNFRYKDIPDDIEIDQVQSIKYSAFITDSLSPKWMLVVIVTPGLASDFEGDLSTNDITFEGVLGLIRKTRKKNDIGFGLAYIRDFGRPIPMPFLYFAWQIRENLKADGLIPSNLNLIYSPYEAIDLGLSYKTLGDRYHGDPDKHGLDNPQLEYSEATVSPMVQINFTKWMHLNMEGGLAFARNFEFLDGNDKIQSLDLKPAGYFRTSFILGM
jgi:hypothetical protein